MSEPIHIISLGAGVQSSTMALMAAKGEITPMPQFAVFADTGIEPIDVYGWLEELERILPFPVYIAKRNVSGNLADNLFEWGHSQIPAFFKNEDGSIGIGKRQCTRIWKIDPVKHRIRELLGVKGKRLPVGYVHLWQGISVDEASRAKDSREPWIEHVFPLLDARKSRHDCSVWLETNGYWVPKSACWLCPFRSDAQWRKSKSDPLEWEKIKTVDSQLNARGEYLHSSCKPIDQVDFSTEEERGQLNMFNNECEGMCGV